MTFLHTLLFPTRISPTSRQVRRIYDASNVLASLCMLHKVYQPKAAAGAITADTFRGDEVAQLQVRAGADCCVGDVAYYVLCW
jgi:hypothetical protein